MRSAVVIGRDGNGCHAPGLIENPLVAVHGMHGIGSDQMHVQGETPVVPQRKFSALTNSRRHHARILVEILERTRLSMLCDLRSQDISPASPGMKACERHRRRA